MNWMFYAFLSAIAAGATAVLAKNGVRDGRLKARLRAGDTELTLRGAPDALPPSMSFPRSLPTKRNRQ